MDDQCAARHQALCAALQIDGESSYPATKKAFVDRLAAMDPSRPDGAEELCALFFDYCTAWHTYLGGAASDSADHDDAARLKIEAGAITRNYQKVILQLALCRMTLRGIAGRLDSDISRAAAESNPDNSAIQWTYDLPPQVALMTRRRSVLSDYMVRIRRAKPIVEKLEFAFAAQERILRDLTGDGAAKSAIEDFTGLLRKHRYRDARKLMQEKQKKDMANLFRLKRKERRAKWQTVCDIADVVAGCVEKRATALTGRGGRLFLRQWEVTLAYDGMSKELDQARQFLDKYEVPEIRYRRDALDRQEESLARLATIDDMLAVYEDLLKGRFFPMKTLKDARAFEAGPLKKVNFAIETLSRDIENAQAAILKLAEGPDPESVPDDRLFENLGDIPALAGGL